MGASANKRIVVLGASRGFGAAITQRLLLQNNTDLMIAARGEVDLQRLANTAPVGRVQIVTADFTVETDQLRVLQKVKDFAPTHILSIAGGGPYGRYGTKEFKDHQWAFRLNFGFPALLVHDVLKNFNNYSVLNKLVTIGSQIAEAQPDPGAASYAAAKHALRGLIDSINAEGHGHPSLEISLFSPGYMDTGLLPKNARPRQEGLVESLESVTDRFFERYNLA